MTPQTSLSAIRLCLAVLALLAASCAARSPASGGLTCSGAHLYEDIGEHRVRSFRGVIKVRYSAGDTYPLPDVLVQARPVGSGGTVYSTQSKPDGSFALNTAPLGAYEILICKEGFAALHGRIVLSRGAKATEVMLETHLD
jgi:hypothetical protein